MKEKEVKLFKHNEDGYEKLCSSLQEHNCSTINHATGTGKTFIALKYMYENRNKRILYLAPTYPILEQTKNSTYKLGLIPNDIQNVDMMIYRSLLDLDMKELYKKYDVIIFDEYHRCGAKETYKKIKQLKLLLNQDKDSDKKFIGLTATPIRYLDHERNMTNEIFDGVVASSLSLSRAMIDNLLPIPEYINSKMLCKDRISRDKRRIKKLKKSNKRDNLEKKIEKIGKKIDNDVIDTNKLFKKYIKQKNGKYIVFCDSIESLYKYYNEADKWFSGIGNIKKYAVYSGQSDRENRKKGIKLRSSREVNQANLDAFNNDNEGISILFCIDILNEGVHVDGIDGVIMLRKTMSPRIYFQQLGRALAFSNRKKQIKIFDLVNNFDNHSAIDLVYEEFKTEIRRLIEIYPEKKDEYLEILSRFKIMDETKEIISELDNIEEELSYENIVLSKIEYAISVLEKYNNEIINIFQNKETNEAYEIIARYYKYVNNEQFKLLLDLGIFLPKQLSMTYEERIELLNGFSSLYEKEKNQATIFLSEICEFIRMNGAKPNINSENENEKKLAEMYYDLFPLLDEKAKKELCDIFVDFNIELESWEKVLLNLHINQDDLNKIICISKRFLDDNKQLPSYLYFTINRININYTLKENEILFNILEKSDDIEKEERIKSEEERIKRISDIISFLENNSDMNLQELMQKEVFDDISKLSKSDINYIRRKILEIKGKSYKNNIFGIDDNSDITIFVRKYNNSKIEEIQDCYEEIEQKKEMLAILNSIIVFMVKNNGNLPDIESNDENEKRLAEKLKGYIDKGYLSSSFNKIEEDLKVKWFSTEEVLLKVISDSYSECETKLALLKYLEFFNRNNHRPLKNSKNEEERKIAELYEEKCLTVLSDNKIQMVNKIFNSKNSIRNTVNSYINNLIGGR